MTVYKINYKNKEHLAFLIIDIETRLSSFVVIINGEILKLNRPEIEVIKVYDVEKIDNVLAATSLL